MTSIPVAERTTRQVFMYLFALFYNADLWPVPTQWEDLTGASAPKVDPTIVQPQSVAFCQPLNTLCNADARFSRTLAAVTAMPRTCQTDLRVAVCECSSLSLSSLVGEPKVD